VESIGYAGVAVVEVFEDSPELNWRPSYSLIRSPSGKIGEQHMLLIITDAMLRVIMQSSSA